jgi:hypothetical protein
MKRFILTAGVLLGAATFANAQETAPVIDVLKQASCGCCGGWVVAMREAGFIVNVQNVTGDELYAAKEASGIPEDLWACHTASISGYTVEGHVPAAEVWQLLDELPPALGIATPGMPVGSPGMEHNGERQAYDVTLVNLDGSSAVYASYPGN